VTAKVSMQNEKEKQQKQKNNDCNNNKNKEPFISATKFWCFFPHGSFTKTKSPT